MPASTKGRASVPEPGGSEDVADTGVALTASAGGETASPAVAVGGADAAVPVLVLAFGFALGFALGGLAFSGATLGAAAGVVAGGAVAALGACPNRVGCLRFGLVTCPKGSWYSQSPAPEHCASAAGTPSSNAAMTTIAGSPCASRVTPRTLAEHEVAHGERRRPGRDDQIGSICTRYSRKRGLMIFQ
jgi:hypothetical protein